MYGPITLGRSGSKIDWRNMNILCKALLGYIPEPGKRLTKEQLTTLGFVYASGAKPFRSSTYGHIQSLL